MEYSKINKLAIAQLPADRWKEYREIRIEAIRDSPMAFIETEQEALDCTEEAWKSRMYNMWFAMMDSRVIGTIGLLEGDVIATYFPTIFSTYQNPAVLVSMYVSVAYRRQGVGKQLVQFMQKYAQEHGLKKLFLYVSIPQTAAAALYESLGFIKVGKPIQNKHQVYTQLMLWDKSK